MGLANDSTEIFIRDEESGVLAHGNWYQDDILVYGRYPDGRTWHKLLPYIEKEPPCRKGDILYVREAWDHGYIGTSDSPGDDGAWLEPLDPNEVHGPYIEALGRYFYKADKDAPGPGIGTTGENK